MTSPASFPSHSLSFGFEKNFKTPTPKPDSAHPTDELSLILPPLSLSLPNRPADPTPWGINNPKNLNGKRPRDGNIEQTPAKKNQEETTKKPEENTPVSITRAVIETPTNLPVHHISFPPPISHALFPAPATNKVSLPIHLLSTAQYPQPQTTNQHLQVQLDSRITNLFIDKILGLIEKDHCLNSTEGGKQGKEARKLYANNNYLGTLNVINSARVDTRSFSTIKILSALALIRVSRMREALELLKEPSKRAQTAALLALKALLELVLAQTPTAVNSLLQAYALSQNLINTDLLATKLLDQINKAIQDLFENSSTNSTLATLKSYLEQNQ